jgi:PST family polysaccharide transporter
MVGGSGNEDTASGFGQGMAQLALANAAYVATAYVVTTATARVLGPEEFGSFGVVMAWITILTALLVKGLSTSITREMAAGAVDPATAWRAGRSLGIRMSIALAVIGALLSPLAASLFGDSAHARWLAVGALGALTFGTNAVLLAWPTGRRDYARQSLAQVAYAVARLVLVVGGAYAFGIAGAVVGYVLAPLLSSLSILARVPAAAAAIAPVRGRMWRAVVPVSLVAVAISAWFVVDVFVASATLGADSAQLGAYVAFGTVAHVPFFLLQASSVAMVPALAAARGAAARRDAITRTLTDTVVLLAGPVLVLAVAGDAMARVVFGSAFAVDGLVAAPLALATGAVTLLSVLVAVDVAIGRLGAALAINAVGIAAMAGACAWAGSRGGADASDIAWAVVPTSLLAAAALAIHVRARHGALVDHGRAARGVLLAVVVALPPLTVADDLARTLVAVGCGVAWVVLVTRLRLVDLRRSAPVSAADVDAQVPR